jgi:hypothetical protein
MGYKIAACDWSSPATHTHCYRMLSPSPCSLPCIFIIVLLAQQHTGMAG